MLRKTKMTLTALILMISGLSLAQAPPAAPDRARAGGPPSYLITIALLKADVSGDEKLEGLSEAGRVALEDIREFLPFKSYQLLDVALTRSSHDGRVMLNGPNDQDFSIEFVYDIDAEHPDRLLFAHFEMVDVTRPSAAGVLAPGEAPSVDRYLLNSSFAIELGETIVVGSSKLDGPGKALVVLLTAIP